MEQYREEGAGICEACKATSELLSNIYRKASIEPIDPKKIYQKVMRLQILKRNEEKLAAGTIHLKSGKLRCQGKERRKTKTGKLKIKIGDILYKLFEIAKFIPSLEKEFYEDQQTVRKMVIGKVDIKVTKVLNEEIMLEAENDEKLKKKADNRAKREEVE